MEAKQFTELLRAPLLVEQLPVEELRELVNLYPYSSSLQMLLLKHYQLAEHPAYDEQMGKAAIGAPDRRALYRLVQLKEAEGQRKESAPTHTIEAVLPELETVAIAAEPQPEQTATAASVENVVEGTFESIEPTEVVTSTEKNDINPVEDITPEHTPVAEENFEPTVTEPDYGIWPPVIPQVHLDEAEPSITEEPIAAETNNTDTALEPEEEVMEPIAVAEEEATTPSYTATEPDTKEELAPEPVVSEREPQQEETTHTPDTAGTHSFTDWLHRMRREDGNGTKNTQAATEEKSELDALFKAGTYEASLVKASSEMPDVVAEAKPVKEELHVADTDANRRMDAQARKSLNRGEELVTETLAKIYEIQKKYAKAIEAYEILKLRHPENARRYDRKIELLREA